LVTLILRRWFAHSLGDAGADPQRTVRNGRDHHVFNTSTSAGRLG
jgi:hypothetical protein